MRNGTMKSLMPPMIWTGKKKPRWQGETNGQVFSLASNSRKSRNDKIRRIIKKRESKLKSFRSSTQAFQISVATMDAICYLSNNGTIIGIFKLQASNTTNQTPDLTDDSELWNDGAVIMDGDIWCRDGLEITAHHKNRKGRWNRRARQELHTRIAEDTTSPSIFAIYFGSLFLKRKIFHVGDFQPSIDFSNRCRLLQFYLT